SLVPPRHPHRHRVCSASVNGHLHAPPHLSRGHGPAYRVGREHGRDALARGLPAGEVVSSAAAPQPAPRRHLAAGGVPVTALSIMTFNIRKRTTFSLRRADRWKVRRD